MLYLAYMVVLCIYMVCQFACACMNTKPSKFVHIEFFSPVVISQMWFDVYSQGMC